MTEPQPRPDQPPQAQRGAAATEPPPQATLRCPFCGSRRFDYGREIYAGAEPTLYCRIPPTEGRRPDPNLSLPMKGAVCLGCGYVAMMLDLAQLRAPIRRSMEVADVLAEKAGAAAHLARSGKDQAAEALARMRPGGPKAASPEPRAGAAEGMDDLDTLLDEAERQLGLNRRRRKGK
jgi:hypothetical protein